MISCTFSLFFSLKASSASLYSFSCDKLQTEIHYEHAYAQQQIYSHQNVVKVLSCVTFFWQVCPSGFNSLLIESIFLRTCETSFLIGSASPSSSWKFHNLHNKEINDIKLPTTIFLLYIRLHEIEKPRPTYLH